MGDLYPCVEVVHELLRPHGDIPKQILDIGEDPLSMHRPMYPQLTDYTAGCGLGTWYARRNVSSSADVHTGQPRWHSVSHSLMWSV
jgi:hypothetical protein